ncbi:hypothetical protein BH10PSE11_BH10PSE11_05460 [soil metagenome]
MTDHTADGEIKDTGHHSEASLVPATGDMVQHDAKAADTPQASASTHVARQPSKEITLQRLTSHSSWEDIVSEESAAREQQFNAAPAATARRLSMAAIVAIASAVGAIGGSLATVGAGHYMKGDQTAAVAAVAAEQGRSVESAIGKINADIAALKSSSAAQSAKIVDRIDRVEKAQAEPAAKLAKLSEAVEKLRAPAPAAEVTGSIAKPAAAPANRLPVVEGWALRDVSDGIATVIGRQGIFDVIPGDPLPGVGRVDAIRRQDGRWVVVTSRGLIVAR